MGWRSRQSGLREICQMKKLFLSGIAALFLATTGINFFTAELVAKRLALLHELVPGASRIGVLVNPADPARVESVLGDAQTAAISSRQPVLSPASGQR